MSAQESKDNLKLFTAAIAGLAIGVGIGLLFASEKGAELRNKIKTMFDEFMDDEEKPETEAGLNDPEKDFPV